MGRVFLMLGLTNAISGTYFFWTTQDLLKTGLRSPGKVIELYKPPTTSTYTPVVQFETSEHRVITTNCKIASNPPIHKVADSVTVIYRAESPEDIYLDEPLDLWILPGIFGALGLVFTAVGGGILIYRQSTGIGRVK